MANKRFIVRHGLDNSGDNSVVNTITNVAEPVNNSDAATKYYVDTHVTGGTVTSVTATSPVESTGGTTPVISLGTGANGQLVIGTGTGFTKSTLTAGTGVSIANASGSITISATGSGGDVVGPASSTDNAVVRFDGTTGKLIQNSTATLSDAGLLTVSELSTTSITSTGGATITIAPDGMGDVHLNADSVRIGDNNTDATLTTHGTGDLILTTHENSATEGVIRLYDGANGNITLTPNGTGQVQVGSDQVVTLTASQTLTNKSLSGSSNTFTNIPNSATTAASANTASAIVARDASGNFSAGTITATLSGNATNVTGTVAVANGGTGLTSLTAGYIPYGNGTSAFGSSADLFWDSANSRLGIGTSTINNRISVGVNTTNADGIVITNANNSAVAALTTAGTSGYGISGWANSAVLEAVPASTGGFVISAYTGNMIFQTGGRIERMRLNDSGSLGLGTASPTQKLDVLGRLKFRASSGGASAGVWYTNSSGSEDVFAGLQGASSTDSWGVYSNGDWRFTITNSGSIGIGTVSPSAKLQVNSSGNTPLNLVGSAACQINLNDGTQNANWGLGVGGVGITGIASPSTYPLVMYTNGSERMRIDSSGNVGIGVSSPAHKLDVSVNVNAIGGARITNTNTGSTAIAASLYSNNTHTHEIGIVSTNYGGYGALTASNFYLYAGGNNSLSLLADGTGVIKFGTGSGVPERMRIDSNGRWLLGTSSGVGQDFASIRFNSGGSYPQGLNMVDSNSSANGATFQVFRKSDDTYLGNIRRNSTDNAIYVGGNSYLALGSGDTEQMRLNSTGLGIGTSSPSAKLDVNGQVRAAYASGFQVDNAGTMLGKLYYSGGLILDRAASTSLFIAQNGSNQVTLDSSGNLGLGTTSIGGSANDRQLTVRGVTSAQLSAWNGSAYSNFGINSSSVGYVEVTGANPLAIYTNGSERMRITSGGLVGIGVSSPSSNLSISSSSDTGIRIKGGSSALSYIDFDEADSGTPNGSIAYVHASNYMTFATGGSNTERMRITSTEVKATVPFIGNSGTKGFGAVTTTTSTSTPTGGSSGDHYYIY